MKKTAKALLMVLCALLLVGASVAGTVAYLTSRVSVVNTFTVGKITITLDEAAVNKDGTYVTDHSQRVQANSYHLLPGQTYIKDPTVTVLADSEDAYVRMLLTVHNAGAVQAILDKYGLGDFSALIGGWDKDTWLYKGYTQDTTANTVSFEFRYKEIVAGSASQVVLPALFDALIVPGEITGDEMQALYDGGFKLEVFGHAIQAAGFTAEDLAWAAFGKQVNP